MYANEMELEIYERRFKQIIGFDVVLSIIWFQYFQLRFHYHSDLLNEPNLLETLWSVSTNPTIIGIILSSLSVWICYAGVKIVKEGRRLEKISDLTAYFLYLWWGLFGIIEAGALALYSLNINNLTTGFKVITDIIQTIIDALRDAY